MPTKSHNIIYRVQLVVYKYMAMIKLTINLSLNKRLYVTINRKKITYLHDHEDDDQPTFFNVS